MSVYVIVISCALIEYFPLILHILILPDQLHRPQLVVHAVYH